LDLRITEVPVFVRFLPDAKLVNFASGLPIGRPGAVRYISEA